MPSSTEDATTQAQHAVYGTAAYDVAGAAQMRSVEPFRVEASLTKSVSRQSTKSINTSVDYMFMLMIPIEQ
jgi:hypothetical protein